VKGIEMGLLKKKSVDGKTSFADEYVKRLKEAKDAQQPSLLPYFLYLFKTNGCEGFSKTKKEVCLAPKWAL
jgi:hypothetical protein